MEGLIWEYIGTYKDSLGYEGLSGIRSRTHMAVFF